MVEATLQYCTVQVREAVLSLLTQDMGATVLTQAALDMAVRGSGD